MKNAGIFGGMRWKSRLFLLASLGLSACGVAGGPQRANASRLALTFPPEAVELESAATRQQLFVAIATAADLESGRDASPHTLFPMLKEGRLVAAPGFDPRADLLQTSDAGSALQLVLDGPTSPRGWPKDGRLSLYGLSEYEAASFVASSLLTKWNISPDGPVQVVRVPGAPYAAAYVDGVFQLNPALLYLAAAASPANQ